VCGRGPWKGDRRDLADVDLTAGVIEEKLKVTCVWAHRPLSEIYASNVTIRAATYDAINGKPMDWSSQARARRAHEMGPAALCRLQASVSA